MTTQLPFGEPIQLGTGQETSVNALVDLMRQVVGEPRFPRVKQAPSRPGEVQRNFMNISRAQQFLHFAPTTDLPAGLQKTWEWFQGLAMAQNGQGASNSEGRWAALDGDRRKMAGLGNAQTSE